MNIYGNGIDIVENKRIEKAIKKKIFLKKIFTNSEILNSKTKKNKANFFAKRFAAKESFVKALGTGFRNNINYKDISITNNHLGKPKITINNKLKRIIKKKFKIKKYDIFLSISDEKKHSIAFVIISGV